MEYAHALEFAPMALSKRLGILKAEVGNEYFAAFHTGYVKLQEMAQIGLNGIVYGSEGTTNDADTLYTPESVCEAHELFRQTQEREIVLESARLSLTLQTATSTIRVLRVAHAAVAQKNGFSQRMLFDKECESNWLTFFQKIKRSVRVGSHERQVCADKLEKLLEAAMDGYTSPFECLRAAQMVDVVVQSFATVDELQRDLDEEIKDAYGLRHWFPFVHPPRLVFM